MQHVLEAIALGGPAVVMNEKKENGGTGVLLCYCFTTALLLLYSTLLRGRIREVLLLYSTLLRGRIGGVVMNEKWRKCRDRCVSTATQVA
jgi:hypothetical protein